MPSQQKQTRPTQKDSPLVSQRQAFQQTQTASSQSLRHAFTMAIVLVSMYGDAMPGIIVLCYTG